ncbi:hypothetical protein [Flavisphingomonas formosensis]|uniref:hypothetical protein n=1 Tax=Flavisphingomonas formosensis TaxID=861534 RepID=UPI0012FA380A|nr:hypothetical protein [Sphingomonas formosensis]
MATSIISICNLALVEVPSKSIASLDEQSLPAAKCREHYPAARDELMELHDWEFLAKRVALAAVPNDRPTEWACAYAVPNDMLYPRRILPPQDPALAVGAFATAGQRAAPCWHHGGGEALRIPYLIEAGILYSDQPNAVLAYSRSGVTEDRFPQSFVRALSLDLATRIVMPLIKNRARQGDLIKASENAKQRAMAQDLNRSPHDRTGYVSEAARARRV